VARPLVRLQAIFGVMLLALLVLLGRAAEVQVVQGRSEVGAALISPSTGFNRLVFGERFAPVFPSLGGPGHRRAYRTRGAPRPPWRAE